MKTIPTEVKFSKSDYAELVKEFKALEKTLQEKEEVLITTNKIVYNLCLSIEKSLNFREGVNYQIFTDSAYLIETAPTNSHTDDRRPVARIGNKINN
jgi:hypothetical protein